MKPKLILINGNPGMGKTTLASRYIQDYPLALNLDVDILWHMMGRWQEQLEQSQELKYRHAYALADAHLRNGYNVVVADLLETTERHEQFEFIANGHNAEFREVVLISDKDTAIERCKERARRMGYADGFRPGGVLDTHGREAKLAEMYENVLTTLGQRKNSILITPKVGDIETTYRQFLRAIR